MDEFPFPSLVSTVSVPLLALSIEAQSLLSASLNPAKIIPTEGNLPRDWRGVAELFNIPAENMSLFECKSDPFKEVLSYLAGSGKVNLSIDDLKAFLALVDRFDILEDVTPVLDRDIATFRSRISEMQLTRTPESVTSQQDSTILTLEDALRVQNKLPLCRYDAFILYSDEDSEFATEVITRMETEYNLKLCSKDRDLLPGLRFEHEVIGKIIQDRCNRLLVIFSPSFLSSNANQFLVSYAQAVALDTHTRKIIPCVYKKCELPPSVRYSFCIDYNRSGKLWNFWDKLGRSLVVPSSANSQISGSIPDMKASKFGSQNATLNNTAVPKDDLEWWDANKPDHIMEKEVSVTIAAKDTEINANHYSKSSDDPYDAVSINSQAQLLPGVSSTNGSKSSNWLSKIMSPMSRKKRRDKEKSKPKPIAE